MFHQKLLRTNSNEALKKPKGKDAKEILSQILPVLSFAGRRNHFGAFDNSTSIPEAIALSQQHWGASVFLTISPDDISNVSSFRLTFRSTNNKDFPSHVTPEFIDAIKNESTYLGSGNTSVPTDYSVKARRAMANPVAVVREYKRLVDNVLSILVGADTEQTYKKTRYYKSNRKGAFGHILAGEWISFSYHACVFFVL